MTNPAPATPTRSTAGQRSQLPASANLSHSAWRSLIGRSCAPRSATRAMISGRGARICPILAAGVVLDAPAAILPRGGWSSVGVQALWLTAKVCLAIRAGSAVDRVKAYASRLPSDQKVIQAKPPQHPISCCGGRIRGLRPSTTDRAQTRGARTHSADAFRGGLAGGFGRASAMGACPRPPGMGRARAPGVGTLSGGNPCVNISWTAC
jgi:hypothetical protein